MLSDSRHWAGTALGAAVLLPALLAGCSGAPAITSCEAGNGLEPDCRFQNPEDLVVSPGRGAMLVSQFGDMAGAREGSLAAYDPASGRLETLFPGDGTVAPQAGWGEAACEPPPAQVFSPHGIDIEQRSDGRHALYVVNHGGRESVEMFEVLEERGWPALLWRGCVLAPERGYFNDLVVLRDGGFWVSHMYPRDANVLWLFLRMTFTGHAPGFAYHWQPEAGFRRMPGTETRFANGIEKSADERFMFLNSYLGDALLKIDVSRGVVVGRAEVDSPDNVTWSPTGELLEASHLASIADTVACGELEEGSSCGFRFQVVAVDPDTLSTRVLLDQEGPPMGGATVALPFADGVYLGTFAGDRITRAPAAILERPAE